MGLHFSQIKLLLLHLVAYHMQGRQLYYHNHETNQTNDFDLMRDQFFDILPPLFFFFFSFAVATLPRMILLRLLSSCQYVLGAHSTGNLLLTLNKIIIRV